MQEVMQYMKIMFASLGCDKNLVDTENMLGILNDKGFEFTDDETQADVMLSIHAVLLVMPSRRVSTRYLRWHSTRKMLCVRHLLLQDALLTDIRMRLSKRFRRLMHF